MTEVIMQYSGEGEDLHDLTRVGELVRCKDCKYQDKGENESASWNICGFRSWLYVPVTDDHYCGDGKRKEEEAEEE